MVPDRILSATKTPFETTLAKTPTPGNDAIWAARRREKPTPPGQQNSSPASSFVSESRFRERILPEVDEGPPLSWQRKNSYRKNGVSRWKI